MRTTLRETVAPSELAVDLSEIKESLRVAGDSDDLRIETLVRHAEDMLKRRAGHVSIATTFEETFPCWPECGYFELWHAPLISVTSFNYYDEDGAQQAYANYQTLLSDMAPARIYPALDERFSEYSLRVDRKDAITITYQAGYATQATVPDRVKQTIKHICRVHYDYPDGDAPPTVRRGMQAAIDQQRIRIYEDIYH